MQPEIIPQMGPRDVDWLKVALVDRSGDLGGGPEVLAAPNVAIGGVAMEKNCAETCLVALSTNRPEKEHRIVSTNNARHPALLVRILRRFLPHNPCAEFAR